MKAMQHLKTITRHKIKVGRLCFRIGLYKQGFLHDMSKYMPSELITGIRYYQGTRSPNAREREEKGYSCAWLHHKGRNKHHWEYWVDFTHDGLKPAPMPVCYILEMFCDRVGASMTYCGREYCDEFPWNYYQRGKDSYIMHPKTRQLLEHLLLYLKEHGLDETLSYIKTNIKE